MSETTRTATVVVEPASSSLSTAWFTVYSSDDPSEATGQDGCDSYHTDEVHTGGVPGTWPDVIRQALIAHVARTRPAERLVRLSRLTGTERDDLLADLREGAAAFRVTLEPLTAPVTERK